MKWNLALNNEMRMNEMKWDENETLHLIMMMVKKTIQKTIFKTLFTKIIYLKKINEKFNYYPPPFSFPFPLSENRNKIIKKMYYPWIHYMVQNWHKVFPVYPRLWTKHNGLNFGQSYICQSPSFQTTLISWQCNKKTSLVMITVSALLVRVNCHRFHLVQRLWRDPHVWKCGISNSRVFQ